MTALAVALLAAAIVTGFADDMGGALVFAIFGIVIALSIVLEPRYRNRTAGGDWRSTAERFVDPESGKTMTVEVERHSGARRYVEEHRAI